ncbi:MAG: hypothetical protein IKI73_00005, partial [Firmicutes bacterium]|nr:hypothetical protein [Bacillota bacterium]
RQDHPFPRPHARQHPHRIRRQGNRGRPRAQAGRRGFEILDFPCNQFGEQAPGTDAEITEFCTINFGVSFKQFSKIDVNGENEAPLYTYLKNEKGGILGTKIKWNFTKFLVDREGHVVERYAPTVTPERIEPRIKDLL